MTYQRQSEQVIYIYIYVYIFRLITPRVGSLNINSRIYITHTIKLSQNEWKLCCNSYFPADYAFG